MKILLLTALILFFNSCENNPVTDPLTTFEHDGHKFVVHRGSAMFLHHPSCKCIKPDTIKVAVAFPQQMKIITAFEKQPSSNGVTFSEQVYLVPDTTTIIK